MAPKMEGVSSESGEDSSNGPTTTSRRSICKSTEEYRKRRERNNQAVKKSREKTKLKTQQMMDRVTQLRSENDELEKNIETLTKELHLLKELFMSHAGSAHGVQVNEEELTRMLVEDPEVNEGVNLLLSLAKGPPPRPASNGFL